MYPVISPNNSEEIGSWSDTPAADIDRYLEGLSPARLGSLESLECRRDLLVDFINEIDRNRVNLADIIVKEVAKKPAEANDEIDYAVAFLSEYVACLDSYDFETTMRAGRSIREVGHGVAVLICPYNDPIAGLCRKIGPAVAAGCPFILKPSPLSVLTSNQVMELFHTAGGSAIGQIVLTDDPETVGRMIGHDAVGVVSFTGSTKIGRKVAIAAGRAVTKCVLELGGNCPYLVFPDADLDKAVADLVERKLKAAGQACSAVNRVFVHRTIFAAFRDRLFDRISGISAGPARKAGIDLAPVRTRQSVERLNQLVTRARDGGEKAHSVEANIRLPKKSFLFPMTVIEAGEDSNSVLDLDEAFGPLLSLRPFTDSDEIINRVAAERHALAIYAYGATKTTKESIVTRCAYGSIGFDTTRIQSPSAPTGGFRNAGYGREGGVYGMREFLATKNICDVVDG